MDENDLTNLDVEFKRYLQILQPNLAHLVNHDVISTCNSWIERLSNCNEAEKSLRNKYIFALCYQVAKGFIDDPFTRNPPDDKLPLISDDLNSEDSSTEIACVLMDSGETTTKVLFNSEKSINSETESLTQGNDRNKHKVLNQESFIYIKSDSDHEYKKGFVPNKQTILCYAYPKGSIPCQSSYDCEKLGEETEHRAIKLINKLRDIKEQNRLLQDELHSLKQNSMKCSSVVNEEHRNLNNDNISSSTYVQGIESNATLKSLNCRLHEIQDSRNYLIEKVACLQDKLDNFEDIKKLEIQEIGAKHKLEIIEVKTSVRKEVKDDLEKKIEELKQNYENTIRNIQHNYNAELTNLNKSKDEIIAVKNKEITEQDVQINQLKSQLEDLKNKFNVVVSKFVEISGGDVKNDSYKYKSEQLEKRLIKLEHSKGKCVKSYEAKIAYLQREKQFAECSLHLQLAKQRAQVVNEVTDESQTKINTALDKLEAKYKSIVANVQATAIQRRMQDQIALESILQAAYGSQTENCHSSKNQFTMKIPQNQTCCTTKTASLYTGNKVEGESLGESGLATGYCLNGERMGQLFEKVYVPQRDNGEPLK